MHRVRDEHRAVIDLHGSDFRDVSRFESIKSRDGSIKSWDSFSEIIFTLVFDCLSSSSGFIGYCFISCHNLQTHQPWFLVDSTTLIPSRLVHLLKISLVYRVQNAAARFVAQKSFYLSLIDTLRELHWLPIQWHIKFKLAALTFKAIHNEVPPYFSRLLTPYRPSRVLRSSFSSNLLQVPRTNLTFGSRSFRAALQLHQQFGIPFLTLSVHPIHLTLSGTTWKHTISRLLLIPLVANPSASDSLVINGTL